MLLKLSLPNLLVLFDVVMFVLTMLMFGGYAKCWWIDNDSSNAALPELHSNTVRTAILPVNGSKSHLSQSCHDC
jgi:hypothetical protein